MSWSGRPKVSDRQFAALLRSTYLHCRLLPIHKLRATTVVPLGMSYRLLRGRPSVRLTGASRKIDLLRVDQPDGNFHVGVEFLVSVSPLVDQQSPSRSRSHTLKSESDSTSLVSLLLELRWWILACASMALSQQGGRRSRTQTTFGSAPARRLLCFTPRRRSCGGRVCCRVQCVFVLILLRCVANGPNGNATHFYPVQ